MISTCTVNPSLDYYLEFDHPLHDGINRSRLEHFEAGGKGVNVSIVLNNLGIPSTAFGLLGGFTGEEYLRLVAKYDRIFPAFTKTDGQTRINVKCRHQAFADLNTEGPFLGRGDLEPLFRNLETLQKEDYLVFSGYLQDYLVEETGDFLCELAENGVKMIADTDAGIMNKLARNHAWLLKTTGAELAEILETELHSEEERIAGACRLRDAGAERVLLMTEDLTAVFVSAEGIYRCALCKEALPVSRVGIGDSMIAGFLSEYLQSGDSCNAFRFASACGTATAYSRGFATKEKINAFYEDTIIEKIG